MWIVTSSYMCFNCSHAHPLFEIISALLLEQICALCIKNQSLWSKRSSRDGSARYYLLEHVREWNTVYFAINSNHTRGILLKEKTIEWDVTPCNMLFGNHSLKSNPDNALHRHEGDCKFLSSIILYWFLFIPSIALTLFVCFDWLIILFCRRLGYIFYKVMRNHY